MLMLVLRATRDVSGLPPRTDNHQGQQGYLAHTAVPMLRPRTGGAMTTGGPTFSRTDDLAGAVVTTVAGPVFCPSCGKREHGSLACYPLPIAGNGIRPAKIPGPHQAKNLLTSEDWRAEAEEWRERAMTLEGSLKIASSEVIRLRAERDRLEVLVDKLRQPLPTTTILPGSHTISLGGSHA